MTHPFLPAPLREGALVVAAGLALYGFSAGIEIAVGAGPVSGAVLEELGKAAVLLLGGWWGGHRPGAASTVRSRTLGTARGLSLGLVAVTIFAGAETLAYFAAFPEAGILARLVWSLPGHLVAALVEALGALCLLRHTPGRRDGRTRWGFLKGPVAWFGALALAAAWHAGANLLASGRLPLPVFTAGALLASLLFLVLLFQFLRQAYLGGFLHGADE